MPLKIIASTHLLIMKNKEDIMKITAFVTGIVGLCLGAAALTLSIITLYRTS